MSDSIVLPNACLWRCPWTEDTYYLTSAKYIRVQGSPGKLQLKFDLTTNNRGSSFMLEIPVNDLHLVMGQMAISMTPNPHATNQPND